MIRIPRAQLKVCAPSSMIAQRSIPGLELRLILLDPHVFWRLRDLCGTSHPILLDYKQQYRTRAWMRLRIRVIGCVDRVQKYTEVLGSVLATINPILMPSRVHSGLQE